MGGVYRARDTRLDRTVAIKVLRAHLRAHLSGNADLRARFEREAKTIRNDNGRYLSQMAVRTRHVLAAVSVETACCIGR